MTSLLAVAFLFQSTNVEFNFVPDKTAHTVTVAGTFNDWNVKALPMEGPDQDGFYSVRQTLRRGVYEYKFVVNGNEWLTDPSNLRTTGALGRP